MDDSNQALDLDELLSHKGFMRAIAMGLLKEEHLADDVVQEAWLAALKKPPLKVRSLRDWLITVVRNVARKKIREESRRRKREQTAAASRSLLVRPASEIVEKEMTRRRVVTAVLSLNEPNRSTLLYRYYDGMKPQEIAKLYDIPVKTVQGRIQRGLTQVRKKLEEKYGGDRKALCLALLPLIGLPTTSSAAAGILGATETAGVSGTGAVPLGLIWKLSLAVIMIMGGFFAYTVFFEDSDSGVQNPSEVNTVQAESSGLHANESEVERSDFVREDRTALAPTRVQLSGRVRDRKTGEPIKAYDFLLFLLAQNGTLQEKIHDTVQDDEGRFSYSLSREGDYRLMVSTSRHHTNHWLLMNFLEESIQPEVELTLDPGVQVSGRVVNHMTGDPLADVLVGGDWTHFPFLPDARGFGSEFPQLFMESDVHARTDAQGRFSLSGLREIPQRITGIHPGYAQSWMFCEHLEKAEITIRMKFGHRVLGRVVNSKGVPVEGATILMQGDHFPLRRLYHTDSQGYFESEPAQTGMLQFEIYPLGDDVQDPANIPLERVVELGHRDIEELFVLSPNPCVRWQGKLLDIAGTPMKRGTIFLVPASHALGEVHRKRFTAEVREEGRFLLSSLPLGSYRLSFRLIDDDRELWVDKGYVDFEKPGNINEDIRISGASVRGSVLSDSGKPMALDPGGVIAKRSEGLDRLLYNSTIDEEGGFCLIGLKPGKYTLKVWNGLSSHYSLQTREVHVEEDQALDNVEMSVSWQGKIRFRIVDFKDMGYIHSILSLKNPERDFNLTGNWLDYVADKQEGVITLPFEAGSWALSFSYRLGEETGFLEKTIRVDRGKTTDVVLSRRDLSRFTARPCLNGHLSWADGSAVSGVALTLVPAKSNCASLSGKSAVNGVIEHGFGEIKTCTDPQGQFEFPAITPGPWNARVTWPDGATVLLTNLLVPVSEGSPQIQHLEIPSGTVSGRIDDLQIGSAAGIEEAGFHLAVFPRKVNQKLTAMWDDIDHPPLCQLFKKNGTEFAINGLAPGDYSLVVNMPGYALHEMEIADFGNGEQRDLGMIRLNACGIVDLELVDAHGLPPGFFSLFINGKPYSANHRCNILSPITELSPTHILCDKLPLGPVTLEVHASGFAARTLELHLKAGERVNAKLTLFPTE